MAQQLQKECNDFQEKGKLFHENLSKLSEDQQLPQKITQDLLVRMAAKEKESKRVRTYLESKDLQDDYSNYCSMLEGGGHHENKESNKENKESKETVQENDEYKENKNSMEN